MILSALIITHIIVAGGILRGVVYDAKTGVGLPGANVIIENTKLGTSTDFDGSYMFSNLKPGEYSILASMLGYKSKKYRIKIKEGEVTELDFYLEEAYVTLEEIVVVGKRPMIEKEVTSSLRTLSREEIEALGVRDVAAVLSNQMGVVGFEDRDIHIRGGRSNEILMVVDGIPVRDPLSGNAFGIYLSSSAIDEYEAIIGGFNAEYGGAMSGVINVKIREGGDKFSGYLRYRTDHTPLFNYFMSDRIEGNLSGPLSFIKYGKAYFFLSGYANFTDTYLPSVKPLYSSPFETSKLSPRSQNELSGVFKLTWKPSDVYLVNLTWTKSIEVNQGYFYHRSDYPFAYGFPYYYINILDHYPIFTRDGNHFVLSLKHVLSERTFYELKLSRFFSNLHIDVNGKHWSEYRERLDIFPPPEDTSDYPGDGFYDAGDAPYWHDHYVETYSFKTDLTHMLSAIHKVKTGGIFEYSEAQWIDIQYPWYEAPDGLGLNHDIYRVYTTRGALYFQDQISFAGMIGNIGLRYEFWIPGKYLEDGVRRVLKDRNLHRVIKNEYESYLRETPTIPFFRYYHIKGHLGPRIGVSYPVTDRDKFFFSYGHFAQMPDFKYVYSKLGRRVTSGYELVGNPNLKPKVTVAYELGWEHLLTQFLKFSITAYYKDIFNYPTAKEVPGEPPNPSYWMYFNVDYARAFGIEIGFNKRLSRYWYGSLEISLSQVKGRSSTEEDRYIRGREEKLGEFYLWWDRPYEILANFGIRVGEDEKPEIGPLSLPSDWRMNIRISYHAGRRYTPVDTTGYEGEVNSKIGPPWRRVDFYLEKRLNIGGFKMLIFIDIYNLFNHKNVYYVNPVTGRAYEYGDPLPAGKRPIDMLNPARYRSPRSVRIGLGASF
jgi:outer membrane receptor protein involved in Fe transport